MNQDTLGSRAACVAAAARVLAAGGRVVVDRVNATPQQRAVWVQVANKQGVGSGGLAVVVLRAPSATCEARIRERAAHPTLQSNTPAATVAQVVANFEHSWCAPAAPAAGDAAPCAEGFGLSLVLDATLPAEELALRLQMALHPGAKR